MAPLLWDDAKKNTTQLQRDGGIIKFLGFGIAIGIKLQFQILNFTI